MKLRVEGLQIEPSRVGGRVEFQFTAPDDLEYVTLEKDDFVGDLELSEVQLEQSTISTNFVEPMESETVASGVFKSVQGISYEITNPNSDTWASIKQSVDGSITTYHNGTLQSTLAQTAEDVLFGVRDIVSGDLTSFNLRLDGIESSVKDEMYHSVRTQLADFIGFEISDLEGNVNTIQNTVDGTVQRIEDTEGNVSTLQRTADATAQSLADLEGNYNNIVDTVNYHSQTIGSDGGNLAQKVMNDRLFQINVIDEIAGAKSSYTQLANQIGLRVGDSQITIGGDGIIIDSESVYINDSTKISDGIITNRMVAANAELDGAKIQDATIGSAKIANLDANKITTGTIRGIRAEIDEGLIGGWDLSNNMIYKQTPYGYTTLKPGGDVAIGIASPVPNYTGGAGLQIFHSGRLRWGDGQGVIEPWESSQYKYIKISSTQYIHLKPSLTTWSEGHFYPWENNRWEMGSADYRWRKLFIGNGGIDESSDARLKKDIQDIPKKLALYFKDVKPKIYEMGGKTQFGYLAQDVEAALFKYATSAYGIEVARANKETFNMVGKSESYLALVYRQVSAIKDAQHEEEINQLESRIQKLEETING